MTGSFIHNMGVVPTILLFLMCMSVTGLPRFAMSTGSPKLCCWTRTVTIILVVASCSLPSCSGKACLARVGGLKLPQDVFEHGPGQNTTKNKDYNNFDHRSRANLSLNIFNLTEDVALTNMAKQDATTKGGVS